MSLADRIDALLPQTQCTRCGFAACRPYAEALAGGTTSANLCEPGGAGLVPQLAALAALPLLPPAHAPLPLQIAWIREEDCIGCARCLPACPVDAIVGARRFSHTVIAQDCTGCTLCLAPCPVDCIELRDPGAEWQAPAAADNRRRFLAHQQRAAQRSLARAGSASGGSR
ncbi:MAG: RnfABCDGE type electron transport complex subunit B, partial [Pseudomonadota bacterium]|nr:RnfABCDGE type electron transport complex subunit B [Pseudomonadota bacterium]